MTSELEAKYGFAAQLAELSDEQLINRFNAQVGNRGWGNARMYFLFCLRVELENRQLDPKQIVTDENGLRLDRTVSLDGDSLS